MDNETSTPATLINEQSVSVSRSHLISGCALALFISFFLPWLNLLVARPSGLDVVKQGGLSLVLWSIPVFSALVFFAGLAKLKLQGGALFTALIPFFVLMYGIATTDDSLFKALDFGAYLGLGAAVAMFILACKGK